MFRKNYFTFLLALSLFLVGSLTVFAQNAPVRGTVTMDDAASTPVAGALVEVFRTDINQKGPTAKTSKKGEFSFAGLILGGTYVLSVSGASINPDFAPNVKAGSEGVSIKVNAGDGKRLTEAEVRQALKTPAAKKGDNTLAASANTAATAPQQTTADQKKQQADQKKQQEEYAKQVAEVNAKNTKNKDADAIAAKSFTEGNEALKAKNYDLAITKYDEGATAVPDFAGSTPALLNNKGSALTSRSVATFNQNIKNADPTARLQAMISVKKDLADAADSYSRAWTIIKNAPAADLAANSNVATYKVDTLRGIRETFRLMAATEQVDPTKVDIGKALLPEYMAIETDAAKKTEAQVYLGDVYRVSNDFDNAIIEYKKILETSPDNIDALAGVGLSLVNVGYVKPDKALLQEGANYLQKFINIAPDTNKYKEDAKNLIETLKTDQKVVPQKTPAKKKG